MKTSVGVLWVLSCIVAVGTLVVSVGVSFATMNMPGDSPSLKDAATLTALVFGLVALRGGAVASLAWHSNAARRRLIAWATFATAFLGAIVTTLLLTIATI